MCLTKQSGGWGPWGSIWTHSHSLLSSISAFSTDLKEHFGADKTFTTRCSGSRVQVWVQVWAPACYLAITLEGYIRRQSTPRLYQKTIKGFWPQNQRPSSWGSAQAQLGLIGPASTNTGYFLVCNSRCWQRPACLRETCWMLCKFRLLTSLLLFMWNEDFYWREMVSHQSSAHSLAQ